MALPASIDDFLVPKQLPQNWWLSFGPTAWFRLPGFSDRLNKIRLPVKGKGDVLHPFGHNYVRRLLRDRNFRERAVGEIPEGWKDKYANLNWAELPGEKQMRSLLNNPQTPLTLDRAGLILATVEAILKEHGAATHALRDYVCIAPAIYRLGGFNDTFFKLHFTGSKQAEDRFQELQRRMANDEPAFYHDIAGGHTATRATIEALAGACADLVQDFQGRPEVLPNPNGKDIGPARNEILIFTPHE